MDKPAQLSLIRQKLKSGSISVGSWMQLPSSSAAEIMGAAGYDWVAVDMEHGSISVQQLPDIFRALELGGTLPLARIAEGTAKDCKQALDAGAAGIIVPMIHSAEQLLKVRDYCAWPPAGKRGVGFSRTNLFGKRFEAYRHEAQTPMLVAMIEDARAISDLDSILKVAGLDAVLVGPYDLSASLNMTADFERTEFKSAIAEIVNKCANYRIPCGIHVVDPNPGVLRQRIAEGYRFLAYAIDTVFLNHAAAYDRIGI